MGLCPRAEVLPVASGGAAVPVVEAVLADDVVSGGHLDTAARVKLDLDRFGRRRHPHEVGAPPVRRVDGTALERNAAAVLQHELEPIGLHSRHRLSHYRLNGHDGRDRLRGHGGRHRLAGRLAGRRPPDHRPLDHHWRDLLRRAPAEDRQALVDLLDQARADLGSEAELHARLRDLAHDGQAGIEPQLRDQEGGLLFENHDVDA
mmetsp:Transcript_6066/g.14056  ORF Transcript_6066/g.14056 Transcript_6066/m.14056 type:complete len:204 (-) Transcript_6066:62-673(-)